MSVLFAGPFVGEFGWELFQWQGYIRTLSKQFDKTIVASRPFSKVLYEDFCDEFIPFDPNTYECAGWTNYFYKYRGGLHEKYNPDKFLYIDTESDGIDFTSSVKPTMISYGSKNKDKKYPDVIIHARMVTMKDIYKQSRNWTLHNCQEFVKKLISNGITVGSIGISKQSMYISGTDNYMDIDLSDLANVLANTKMIIGPSSGPMHFATLCRCPQFLWTSNKPLLGQGNRENYISKWNPFNTKVRVYDDEGWNPSVDNIYNGVMDFYEEIINDR